MVEITHPIDHEVQSFDHFITESFSVGIDQLMQNLLVEGARTNGESPCMERSLDVHHSLRSLPLQLAIGGLQSEQTAFLTRLPADGRQPTVIGQIQDGERVIEVGLLAVAMILHPRLDMPPADHKDFMSQGLYLLANLMSAAARLHSDQGRSHVCQKLIELVVGYPVNEIGVLVFRIECSKGHILLGKVEADSFVFDRSVEC